MKNNPRNSERYIGQRHPAHRANDAKEDLANLPPLRAYHLAKALNATGYNIDKTESFLQAQSTFYKTFDVPAAIKEQRKDIVERIGEDLERLGSNALHAFQQAKKAVQQERTATETQPHYSYMAVYCTYDGYPHAPMGPASQEVPLQSTKKQVIEIGNA